MQERSPATVFVSGMKKSGTNWISRLLGTHPDVVVTGELHLELVRDALRAYAAPDWVPITTDELDDALRTMLGVLLDRHRRTLLAASGREGDDVVLVDHTPYYLSLHLGADARYVHIVRDPRDVMVADAFHSMRLDEYPADVAADQRGHIEAWRRDRWYFTEHPSDLLHPAEIHRLTATWVDLVTAALRLAERHPDLVSVVRYEDLHQDAVGRRDELLRFIGLDPAEAPALTPEVLPAFGGRQEDPYAFERHGVVGDHRTYLSPEQADAVEAVAGPLMSRLGYR